MITELEDKYIIFKIDDFEELPSNLQNAVLEALDQIKRERHAEGKSTKNRYVVLNLDDHIDLNYLQSMCAITRWSYKAKVRDIAVDLVNAVLIAKEQGVDK